MKFSALFAICLALTSGCAGVPPTMDVVADGKCPDLTGEYREEGVVNLREKTRLSSMINFKQWMTASPPVGNVTDLQIDTVRISHPSDGVLRLEPQNTARQATARFDVGAADGWQCAKRTYFRLRKDQPSSEANWGDMVTVERLFANADGSLGRTLESWYQRRTSLLLGAPIGSPVTSILTSRFDRR